MTSRAGLEKIVRSEPYVSIPSWDYQLRAVKGDISYLSDYQLGLIKQSLDEYLLTGEDPKAIKGEDPMIW